MIKSDSEDIYDDTILKINCFQLIIIWFFFLSSKY